MNLGNITGAILGVKIVNGKMKPKFGIRGIVDLVILILLFFAFICGTIYFLLNSNLYASLMFFGGAFVFGYVLLIEPYFQKSKNYKIQFQSDDSLLGLKLFYKNKEVIIKYIIDEEGKIMFEKNMDKKSCISYEDGTKMSDFTKYKIINYFVKWLNDYNLMSNKITKSLE